MDKGLIISLTVILVLLALICAAVFLIVHKVREFSRNAFGTSSLSEGIKNQREQLADTPRSVMSMTRIYLPQIQRDFPEFNIEQYVQKSQMLIKDYLMAISKQTELVNPDAGDDLKNQVENIVQDLKSSGKSHSYSDIVIHETQISAYRNNGATVEIAFQSSVGCMSYVTDENGRVILGDKDIRTQTVFETDLVYVQDAEKISDNNYGKGSVGINCPNCGAPVKNLGKKFCEYCGTAIKEVNIYSWNFNRINEITKNKKQY